MDWAALISAAGTIIAIIAAIIAMVRNGKKDTQDDSALDAEMRTRLVYISAGVDEIKVEQRAMRSDVSELATRVTRVEESAKQAHKRLDSIGAGRAPNE